MTYNEINNKSYEIPQYFKTGRKKSSEIKIYRVLNGILMYWDVDRIFGWTESTKSISYAVNEFYHIPEIEAAEIEPAAFGLKEFNLKNYEL